MSFFLLLNTKEDILRMLVTKQLPPLTTIVWKKYNGQKVNGYCQLFGYQYTFKETHTGLEQLENEQMTEFLYCFHALLKNENSVIIYSLQ